MFRDNPLLQQLKQQIKDSLPTAEGQVKATERGFGFLQCEGNKSYFIAPAQMKRIMHGDKVSGVVRESDDGKQSFEPEKLIEAGTDEFIGQVHLGRDGRPAVIADHPLINFPINARVNKEVTQDLAESDWVVAKMLRHPLTDRGFYCEITQLIAKSDDQFARWKATTARHHLAWDAPDDLETYQLAEEQLERQDLTDVEFFTIDSASTRDMDDALSIEKTSNGWQLLVAIADPSAYVSPDNLLEQTARQRGFTLYLPAHTVPMLPARLADELCSLHPLEKRPVLCARISIDQQGQLADSCEFFAAWIESKHRLNYDDVSEWFEQENAVTWEPATQTLSDQLKALKELTEQRIGWRKENAIVFADRPDYRFEINLDGSVVAIHCEPRRIANRMVEEAMIAANISAALTLKNHFGFAVFNTHAGFDTNKIAQVETIVKDAGIEMNVEQLQSFEGFCQLRRVLDDDSMTYLDLRLRKFYSFSEFSSVPQPHFGLGESCYGTWTSPIRKYGDLLNHRLLKAMLLNKSAEAPLTDELAVHLGECRRAHKFAERNMSDYLYSEYYQTHLSTIGSQVGQLFDVTRGGIKVRVHATGAMVFVPATKIHAVKDQLNCDADNGKVFINGECKYQLGDEVTIKVIEVKTNGSSLIAELV
ncbi:exoribonuclease II [Celerinatantimonas yamalensis]|uniref:Exoribonuclease II n=1 Tax=Celerinatantimonas yamalensis TaxID=559956 RepID=A0ABW9G3U2_9GAMM